MEPGALPSRLEWAGPGDRLAAARIHLLFASEENYSEHPSAVLYPLFQQDLGLLVYVSLLQRPTVLTLIADHWPGYRACTSAVINVKHMGGQRLKG